MRTIQLIALPGVLTLMWYRYRWRIQRLLAMSFPEIVWRVGKSVQARFEKKGFGLCRTRRTGGTLRAKRPYLEQEGAGGSVSVSRAMGDGIVPEPAAL